MSKINFLCSQCNHSVEMNIGQTIQDNTIRWYGSYVCLNCGNAEEQDDSGLPSQEIRENIIEKQGEYAIQTSDIKAKVKLLKVLKQHLNIPLSDLTYILAKLPGIFMEGTKTEMEWIQQLLDIENITTSVAVLKSPSAGSEDSEC